MIAVGGLLSGRAASAYASPAAACSTGILARGPCWALRNPYFRFLGASGLSTLSIYDPIHDGMDRSVRGVRHDFQRPPPALRRCVHGFWQLKSDGALANEFILQAVPDACVNLLFNRLDPDIAAVTALRTRSEALNLGRHFHYVGVQLMPGAWRGDPRASRDHFVDSAYAGPLPLRAANQAMAQQDFAGMQIVMAALVAELTDRGLISPDPVLERILVSMDAIRTVQDMATAVHLSPRQLQRRLTQATGLSPRELLKVLRVQRSFSQHYLDLYADQSHYIHSFREVTGYTPTRYQQKFHV